MQIKLNNQTINVAQQKKERNCVETMSNMDILCGYYVNVCMYACNMYVYMFVCMYVCMCLCVVWVNIYKLCCAADKKRKTYKASIAQEASFVYIFLKLIRAQTRGNQDK